MTTAARFKQSEVTRLVKGAIKGGWPVGSFKVVVENGQPALVPVAANASSDPAADAARRIREAFGD
jgi:hypothetical protein